MDPMDLSTALDLLSTPERARIGLNLISRAIREWTPEYPHSMKTLVRLYAPLQEQLRLIIDATTNRGTSDATPSRQQG
jgi:hypothetical protein